MDEFGLLDERGALRLMPAAWYDQQDRHSLRVWCHYNARYGLPTVELVDWLKTRIAGRKSIEIGAGAGDLCYHIGNVGVDNHQQEWPDVKAYYAALQQPTIKYPSWVIEADALEAVNRIRPSVVIGSWVTHWIDPEIPAPAGGGNMYGVKEPEILSLVDEYIVIGNLAIHSHKPIMKLPHEELELPFIRSRAARPELDRVFVWQK